MQRLWIGLILVLTPSFVQATSFYERPFPETVQETSILVRGKIGRSYTDWAPLSDGSKQIFTYTEVTVDEVLKGKAKTGAIRIRELGGEKDGMSLQISGVAEFSPGEDVVLVLDEPSKSDDAYPLQGMMMGKFTVEKGVDGTEYLKGPALRNSGAHAHGGHHDDHGVKEPQTQWSLSAVRELIKKQAQEKASPSAQASKRTSDDGLLKSRSKPIPTPTDDLTPKESSSRQKRRTPSGWVILAGVVAGSLYFLRSRRKKK